MNANHDPFVLKLPPEVASYIFLLSMGERDTREISSSDDCLLTPFLLGAVCSGWRQLARSTPALWTTLAFNLHHSTIMEDLPHLVADWLERSGGLPLTLKVSYYTMYLDLPPDRHGSVIDALNQHSGRWREVEFNLPSDYVGRLCGSSPPENLCDLSICADDVEQNNIPLTFKMNARLGPMKFKIEGFLLEAVDVAWDNLVDLDLTRTPLDGVLQVIRNAPLLEMCSLDGISPPIDGFHIPQIIIRPPYLRTLELFSIEDVDIFHELINSLELPSLESWSIDSIDWVRSLEVDIMISFLNRSGCNLKTFKVRQEQSPAVEDFERFLRAAPCLQHLRVNNSSMPVMDNILERISASPPTQTGHTVGFLSVLQSLELSCRGLNAWACIPLIFRFPHRKLLRLDINFYSDVTIGDDVLEELVHLVDQGIKLSIRSGSQDYLQIFRDRATVEFRD
jgi:hypothetical protein